MIERRIALSQPPLRVAQVIVDHRIIAAANAIGPGEPSPSPLKITFLVQQPAIGVEIRRLPRNPAQRELDQVFCLIDLDAAVDPGIGDVVAQ